METVQKTGLVQVIFCTRGPVQFWNTQKEETRYYKTFLQLQKALLKHAPSLQIVANIPPKHLTLISDNKYLHKITNKYIFFPPIEAFEVFFNKEIIFSKTKTRKWPDVDIIVNNILQRYGSQITKNWNLNLTQNKENPNFENKLTQNIRTNNFKVQKRQSHQPFRRLSAKINEKQTCLKLQSINNDNFKTNDFKKIFLRKPIMRQFQQQLGTAVKKFQKIQVKMLQSFKKIQQNKKSLSPKISNRDSCSRVFDNGMLSRNNQTNTSRLSKQESYYGKTDQQRNLQLQKIYGTGVSYYIKKDVLKQSLLKKSQRIHRKSTKIYQKNFKNQKKSLQQIRQQLICKQKFGRIIKVKPIQQKDKSNYRHSTIHGSIQEESSLSEESNYDENERFERLRRNIYQKKMLDNKKNQQKQHLLNNKSYNKDIKRQYEIKMERSNVKKQDVNQKSKSSRHKQSDIKTKRMESPKGNTLQIFHSKKSLQTKQKNNQRQKYLAQKIFKPSIKNNKKTQITKKLSLKKLKQQKNQKQQIKIKFNIDFKTKKNVQIEQFNDRNYNQKVTPQQTQKQSLSPTNQKIWNRPQIIKEPIFSIHSKVSSVEKATINRKASLKDLKRQTNFKSRFPKNKQKAFSAAPKTFFQEKKNQNKPRVSLSTKLVINQKSSIHNDVQFIQISNPSKNICIKKDNNFKEQLSNSQQKLKDQPLKKQSRNVSHELTQSNASSVHQKSIIEEHDNFFTETQPNIKKPTNNTSRISKFSNKNTISNNKSSSESVNKILVTKSTQAQSTNQKHIKRQKKFAHQDICIQTSQNFIAQNQTPQNQMRKKQFEKNIQKQLTATISLKQKKEFVTKKYFKQISIQKDFLSQSRQKQKAEITPKKTQFNSPRQNDTMFLTQQNFQKKQLTQTKNQCIFSQFQQKRQTFQLKKKICAKALILNKLYGEDIQKQIQCFQNKKQQFQQIEKIYKNVTMQKISNLSQSYVLFKQKSIQVQKIIGGTICFHRALSTIADRNQMLIVRLFENYTSLKQPCFGVWLCDQYSWKCIKVSEYIPTNIIGHENKQVWPMILHKAITLLVGGIQQMEKLSTGELLHMLTGSNCIHLYVSQDYSRNNKLIKFIDIFQKKSMVLVAEKIAEDIQQQNQLKNHRYEIIGKDNVQGQILLKIKENNKEPIWVKMSNFIQLFNKVEVFQLRGHHYMTAIQLPYSNKTSTTVIQFHFQQKVFGSIALATKQKSGLLRLFLYKQQEAVLRLVGKAQQKLSKKLFFDCNFNSGKYVLFAQCENSDSVVSFSGTGKVKIKIREQINTQSLKNQTSQYLKVESLKKHTIQQSRKSNITKISQLKNQFIEYILRNDRIQ